MHAGDRPSRTTPPRPLDVESLFPGLAAHRRAATRLHPRPAAPGVHDSHVGGPLLWPADDPWPICTVPHRGAPGPGPLPLLALAQLHARDVPDLPAGPDGCDLLQVFWCPFDAHGPTGHGMYVLTGPGPMDCDACTGAMDLLLTVATDEWDTDSRSWIPQEDGPRNPTGVVVGNHGRLNIFACPRNPAHPHRFSIQ
ncbi:hypothetical protein ACIQZO_11765 [Streptomyces sp. NPDC097617]|uniref:hypothetical protein n=1 Tax=Streptomyces sp. NPDC097617 TaxID=3366091 RepID=UPI003821D699